MYNLDMKRANIKILIIVTIAFAIIFLAIGYLVIKSKASKFKLDTVSFSQFETLDLNNLPDNVSLTQNLLLINHDNPLSDDFEPDISFYKDTDVLMNTAMLNDYARLSADIYETFENRLYVSSTYRSREDQERVYEEEGGDTAALPGESEHETGLALDVYVMYHAGAGFLDSEEGQFVNSNCSDYGFIIRYPRGKSAITGIQFEPWHIRYVGFPHAEIISENNITLEEYNEYLQVGKWYEYENFYISKQPEDNILIPSDCINNSIVLSPDNCGNIIVTVSVD